MKTAKYNKVGGGTVKIEYDENAPCSICGEPVKEASVGGTDICPWCDMGKCRHCGEAYLTGRETTKEECQKVIKEHIKWHKDNP